MSKRRTPRCDGLRATREDARGRRGAGSPPRARLAAAALLALLPATVAAAEAPGETAIDARAIYGRHCAVCHGERRYGGYAPPLIADTLAHKSDEALAEAILEGLPATQMPAFAGQLAPAEARSLVALLRETDDAVRWSLEDIAASRVEERVARSAIPAEVKRDELILVVERGTGSVSVLDGASLRELDRFAVGRIHGGIKFDRGLHQALVATRDGTVVDYDLDRGAVRTRAKVGVNTRNIAVSDDGAFVAVANQLPQGLVALDARLRPLASFSLPGQPSAVYQVPRRREFMLTLRDLPELYFVSYPDLELRRVELPEPFEDFIFVPGAPRLVASSRNGSRLILYDFERSEILASLESEGLPHLFSASFFRRDGALHAALNHMGAPLLSIIGMDRFEVVAQLPLAGSGYFTRTHPGTPYLWIDSNTDSIQLVDKRTLALVDRKLVPEPGKKAMHIEFTADGSKAMVSIWHDAGAIVIYDAAALEEIQRIPYAMPVGKYNAANKTRELD